MSLKSQRPLQRQDRLSAMDGAGAGLRNARDVVPSCARTVASSGERPEAAGSENTQARKRAFGREGLGHELLANFALRVVGSDSTVSAD